MDKTVPSRRRPGDPLRFLIFGAGAIGTYIGGSLALCGQKVIFLERPEAAEELRSRGMHLRLGDQEHQIDKPTVAASLNEALTLGPFDAAVFALKSFDTPEMLRQLTPYSAALPAFLCLQNGVENEAALAGLLGENRVIAGTVTSAIGRRAVGDIVLERFRGMGLANGHPLVAPLTAALQAAGLNPHIYASAAGLKWSKMLTNLISNATSAILNMTPAEVIGDPSLFRLEMLQLREVLQVMTAQKIKVVDLPGTPVRALAFAARWLPLPIARPLMKRAVGGGRGGKMPSFHIDLYSGRGKSEVDYLNGAVVRFGERLGIPTPVNRLLNETLTDLTQGRMDPKIFDHQPDQLLSRLK